MKWDAEKYDSVRAPQVDAGRELISMAKVNETDKILDIGCGTGKLTVELARLASKGSVTGIDPSTDMLEKARKVFGENGNMRFLQIAAEEMDFPRCFDLAFSNSALQWVKEQRKALELTHRALKQGGRIAFQLPAKNFCKEFFIYAENAISSLGFEKYFRDWQQPGICRKKKNMLSFSKRRGSRR
jgi:trans-aconitate 2-methyltransferase